MNFASTRIDRPADRLTSLTGEDVEEPLSRLAVPSTEVLRAALQEFLDLAAQMPTNDTRSIDEIIGYGPGGLPSS